ncbi:MAG: hypothetical protein ACFNQI_06020, partial [Eikenella corrodens]
GQTCIAKCITPIETAESATSFPARLQHTKRLPESFAGSLLIGDPMVASHTKQKAGSRYQPNPLPYQASPKYSAKIVKTP